MKHNFIVINSGGISSRFIDKYAIMVKYLATVNGRQMLANSMAAPIKRPLDYSGIAKKCLVVDPLPQGAVLTYNTDNKKKFEHKIIVIGSDGFSGNIKSVKFPRFNRVTVPQFEIFSNPIIRMDEIKSRRFDLIDRHKTIQNKFIHNKIVINSDGKTDLFTKSVKLRSRFFVMDKVVEKARQDIMDQEDASIFQIIDNISYKPDK